jgi:hypothetical protein
MGRPGAKGLAGRRVKALLGHSTVQFQHWKHSVGNQPLGLSGAAAAGHTAEHFPQPEH